MEPQTDGGIIDTDQGLQYLDFAPVQLIPTDDPDRDTAEEGIALCLSGGGYRAMLFHLGTLWRLNEAGILRGIKRISSVSGGSITAGMLGYAWPRLDFDERNVARAFMKEVADPIMHLAGKTIDVRAFLLGILPGKTSQHIARYYRNYLFGKSTLYDLPNDKDTDPSKGGPRFVINATNMMSGVLWRFSRPYMADYRVGEVKNPKRISLALAVAASSAFPPFLSPTILRLKKGECTPLEGNDLHSSPFTDEAVLTDGGVYDNLGLETAWKRYRTVLISDGGGKMKEQKDPWTNWISQFLRVRDIADDQVRGLRKRLAIAGYKAHRERPGGDWTRQGAYWTIRADIKDYPLPGTPALDRPAHDLTLKLAEITTRLSRLSPTVQKRLVNWGFLASDAAMRAYWQPDLPVPVQLPFPGVGW